MSRSIRAVATGRDPHGGELQISRRTVLGLYSSRILLRYSAVKVRRVGFGAGSTEFSGVDMGFGLLMGGAPVMPSVVALRSLQVSHLIVTERGSSRRPSPHMASTSGGTGAGGNG